MDVSIRRDYRFTLEENWELNVVPNLTEGVTALTVFHPVDGEIIGWLLHGWKPPPPVIIYSSAAEATKAPVDTKDEVPKVDLAEPE